MPVLLMGNVLNFAIVISSGMQPKAIDQAYAIVQVLAIRICNAVVIDSLGISRNKMTRLKLLSNMLLKSQSLCDKNVLHSGAVAALSRSLFLSRSLPLVRRCN
jgi:hypothetical protein